MELNLFANRAMTMQKVLLAVCVLVGILGAGLLILNPAIAPRSQEIGEHLVEIDCNTTSSSSSVY